MFNSGISNLQRAKMRGVSIKSETMLTFKIERDGEKFHAFCPELKGCHTFGDTPALALKNLKEAVSLYVDDELEKQSFDDLINSDNGGGKI